MTVEFQQGPIKYSLLASAAGLRDWPQLQEQREQRKIALLSVWGKRSSMKRGSAKGNRNNAARQGAQKCNS